MLPLGIYHRPAFVVLPTPRGSVTVGREAGGLDAHIPTGPGPFTTRGLGRFGRIEEEKEPGPHANTGHYGAELKQHATSPRVVRYQRRCPTPHFASREASQTRHNFPGLGFYFFIQVGVSSTSDMAPYV